MRQIVYERINACGVAHEVCFLGAEGGRRCADSLSLSDDSSFCRVSGPSLFPHRSSGTAMIFHNKDSPLKAFFLVRETKTNSTNKAQ